MKKIFLFILINTFLFLGLFESQTAAAAPPGNIFPCSMLFFMAQQQLLSTVLFANTPLWMLGAFQNPYSDVVQTPQDSTVEIYTPGILKPPRTYRYIPDHQKYDNFDKNSPEGLFHYNDVDSSASKVTTADKFVNYELSYPYTMGLDNYLSIRKKKLQNQLWDSLITRYDLASALSGGDIARLISQSTGLTIPIPQNPLMGIFGKPEISINVNGELNLRAGWRWDSQNLGTVSAFGQTQSTPIFSQDIRVNVSGNIGDKMKLSTDWNTRTQFDYNNKFKVGYEGEDDEIIKKVEVGNVSLPLQSSLISGGQALFGIAADFQFGPLFLKTIASQKRGEKKMVDVRGGTSKQYFSIRAYDYAKNHFFLDEAYKKVYSDYFKSTTPVLPPSSIPLRIKEIQVWESTGDVREAAQYASMGVAYANVEKFGIKGPNDRYPDSLKHGIPVAGDIASAQFQRLDSSRFQVDYNLGTIAIRSMRTERYYAVAYRTEGNGPGNEDDQYHGTLIGANTDPTKMKDTLILKLIYYPNLQPGFKTLWQRQMKNIYSINATNVNVQDTKIGIWYINQQNDSSDVLPGATDKLVTIMRVDQSNNSTGIATPDGLFDLRPPFFDPTQGEITFPHLRPFDSLITEYFTSKNTPQLATQFVFPEVYDTTWDVAKRNTARDRFMISGEVSGKAVNKITLGSFNLSPGSVRVTLDGVPLKEYDDYVVDYYSGQLTLRNPRASLPNANLKIEYESQDIFNISTRTLLGLRGDMQILKTRKVDASVGFTAMYYNQSAVVDRARLGEEPVANSMVGLDAKLNWDTPWLTKMLDLLPFYDTKAQSTIGFRGEWAMMLPNPNKRLSEVASDNNQPVVYIDDFEGAQRYISLGLSPSLWSQSSQPQDSSIALNDSLASLFRGKAFWFQKFIPYVPINEVYCNRQVLPGRTNLSPLTFVFNPYERGIYNKNPEFVDAKNPKYDSLPKFWDQAGNGDRIWGGMMRLLSSFTTNFDNENIEYIEIMMKLNINVQGKTKMYIDLGQISEDVIPDHKLSTEDGITAANPVPNNIIDPGEDVGIDGIDDAAEKTSYPYPLNLESDPARDDYSFDFSKADETRTKADFENYNNYEGNSRVSEIGQFPDTEILNKNNGITLTQNNDYFSYEVNLDPNPATNPQIVGGGCNNRGGSDWYLYRIPIRKPTRKVGNPLFSNIQYIRVWFKGAPVEMEIADWRLVGSQWQRTSNIQSNVPPNDSVLQIAFVNREENSNAPDYYDMPPGVQAPKQLGSSLQNDDIRLNEQSLAVSVKNLRYGDERMAVRFFRAMDLFYYKELKFFIHGDGSMPDNIVQGVTPKAYAFIRFGIDSMNYYEYRRPLIRGWQDLKIDMYQLTTKLKQGRDPAKEYIRQEVTDPSDPLATFAIRGNPILTRVEFFACGIANPADQYPNDLTTTMWVDELRLINPESSADWAGVSSMDMKLADLGVVNASIQHTMPNFHRLEERFGNRVSQTNWTVSMQGNLEKFAPKAFKEMKVPISYTHAEVAQDPQFAANNDIRLDSAASNAYENALKANPGNVAAANQIRDSVRTRSQTVKVQDSWALTGVRLGLPINHWLIRETLNRLTVGYSYSQEYERSPIVSQRFNWQWQLTSQYSVNIPDLLAFKPLGWLKSVPMLSAYSDYKINFLPSSFSASMNMVRSRATEQSRFLDYPSPVIRNFSIQRQGQFSWKFSENGLLSPILDYTVNTGSTLVPWELDENGIQRTGSQLASQVLLHNGALINFGENNLHTQNITLNFKPRLPLGESFNRFIDMSGSYNVTYNWNNPMQPIPALHDIAQNASWQNNIRLTTGLRLKSFADQVFGTGTPGPGKPVKDTTSFNPGGVLSTIGSVLKTIFLDYDRIDFNFNQQNSSLNPGVYGGTGMSNLWRNVIGLGGDLSYGPSSAYQLGLVTDPHGSFRFVPSSSFPFFGFRTDPGLRPPNAILQDNFTQRSNMEVRTTRPLWPGAVLDLNWRADLAFNKNQTVQTDANGVPTFSNIKATETFSRNYITISSLFGINAFNNTIEHVVELFSARRDEILSENIDTVTKNQKLLNALGESFRNGLEAFSLFKGTIGKYLPTLNWTIRWDGLEKWPLFGGVAKRISLEHSYNGRYTETSNITDNGRAIENQQITSGFQPLIGITMGFDEKKLSGNLTATVRYSTTNSFQLTSSNRSTISRQASDELQIQSSYTLRGFDFPLFGFSLKNDLEFSLLTSYKKSRTATFDVMDYSNEQGRTLNGNTSIIIEPRARYSLSSRLSAAFFFRYEGTFNEGASNPGYTTTQVGLDIRLSLAGGR